MGITPRADKWVFRRIHGTLFHCTRQCYASVSRGETRMITRRDALALVAATANGQETPGKAPEICFLTATELARQIRRKDLSAREVLDAHLQQIERVNPKVNAIVTLVADQAIEQAKRLDVAAARNKFLGPLHGIPVAHKDLVETK